jgi:DNA-binding SARP family transcriptional activator/TolB-like protein
MFTLKLLGSASLEGPDGPVTGRASLRQRMALLAFLAAEHPRPLSRDKLVAYLWPESGADEARHLLRDSLYIIRTVLGEHSVLRAGDDLRLNPERVGCDLWRFEEALARGDLGEAVGQYSGPLLDGFHLTGADEFERWVEAERTRLARRYAQAVEALAERHMSQGDALGATEWLARLAKEDPYNSRIALRYMQALDASGDRAGALRHATAHSELLRADLDAAPEREVVELAERLRAESRPSSGTARVPLESPPAQGERTATRPVVIPPVPRPIGWAPTGLAALGAVVGLGLVGGAILRARPPDLAPHRVAATVFENRTGRRDLDDLGRLAADRIVRGLMETPLVDVTDMEAVYAGRDETGRSEEPRARARREGAGIVIAGSYYRSGDSVLFQAGLVDVATGRILKSFDPVGGRADSVTAVIEALQERLVGGVAMVLNPAFAPVEPGMDPPSLEAYREFMAGLNRESWRDWPTATGHYRRAAELDSTFVAPLIQLAFVTLWGAGDCGVTDSVGAVLDRQRDRLSPWNRITIDLLRARCRGDMAGAVRLLERRFDAYPESKSAQWQYAWALVHSNQPRASRELLQRLDPDRDCKGDSRRCLGWVPPNAHSEYWSLVAASEHILGEHRAELRVTDRWRDSTDWRWPVLRGQVLGALGSEDDVFRFLHSLSTRSIDSVAEAGLTLANELAAHRHHRLAGAVAESVLARLELTPDIDSRRTAYVVWANLLLGRKQQELAALRKLIRGELDSMWLLKAEGRIAVLSRDTAAARRIDSVLAEHSRRRLSPPWIRGAIITARAHIAAGLGRRRAAVTLLKDASARGLPSLGASFAFHEDPLLAPLRDYPPFEALLQPDN